MNKRYDYAGILGFLLGTVIATIINFFMGTSFSNKLKNESINKLAKYDRT